MKTVSRLLTAITPALAMLVATADPAAASVCSLGKKEARGHTPEYVQERNLERASTPYCRRKREEEARQAAAAAAGPGAGTVWLSQRLLQEEARQLALPEAAIGMTGAEVENGRRGFPDRINRTTTAAGTDEQWVYVTGERRSYLYFHNGVLVALQE